MKWVQRKFDYDLTKPPANFDLTNKSEAARIIISHILDGKKIAVFGDYDVDGVSAASIMYKALNPIIHNKSNLIINLPTREDGYGLNMNFIENCDADLIITVDNGITAVEQIKRAKERGKTVIVTDHHKPQEVLPDCIIVNPQLDKNDYLKNICGAGVAWYLCLEIYHQLNCNLQPLYDMVDILTLATIADMVPMKQANKEIVGYGLKLMLENKFSSDGLRTIVNSQVNMKYGLETDNIGFSVAPIFNAIGRLNNPRVAFDIIANDRLDMIQYAIALNQERKTIQNNQYIESMEGVDTSKNIIVYCNDNIEKGMIGLVAGDLSNKFKKPTVVISNGHGSGRGIYDISIFDIIQPANSAGLLSSFGGHGAAIGLSIKPENIPAFKNLVELIAADIKVEPALYYHDEIEINQLNEIYELMGMIRPFGQENPEPKWRINNLKIISQRIVGANKNVLMLDFGNIKAFKFKTHELIQKDTIDIICLIKPDSLQIEDFR